MPLIYITFPERKHFYFRRLGLFGYLLPKRDVTKGIVRNMKHILE